jgi:hypothetical protein
MLTVARTKITGLFVFSLYFFLFHSLSGQVRNGVINLSLTGDTEAGKFRNYNATIQISVRLNIHPENIMNRYDANPVFSPILTPNPALESFVSNSLGDWVSRLGFAINNSGLVLYVTILQFEINYLSGNGWTGTSKLTFKLLGSNQEELFNQTTTGYSKKLGSADDFNIAAEVINKAYYESLNLVEWVNIARVASNGMIRVNTAQNQNQKPGQTYQNPVTENRTTNQPSESKPAIMLSDIDTDIPVTYQRNENTFAVIIGNEDYANEIKVKYAINDAKTFYEYSMRTLGIPKDNIRYSEDATFGKMLGEIDWLKNVAKAYQGKAKLLFYYAGHGMPDESSKNAYLLPVDGDASTTRTAIKVEELYAALSEYPVQQATVFLDACFSGTARDGMLTSGRGVRIMPKADAPKGNLVIFTAVTGDETAHPYDEKQHGLFSYYLMKKLQETRGDINFQELSDFITTKVNQQSVVSGKEQNPTVNISPSVQNTWGSWKLK